MDILKDTLWLFPHERIKVLEIYKKKKVVFYQYSYQIEGRKGNWTSRVVWHNFEQLPHFDVFDEGGKLIAHHEQERKDIQEIIKLVRIFRKNLMNMDLTKI
ncbi:MAG: hypothetical protein JSV49_10425 [Thermoplasmata archaeon]|nr:MAG: hypothetical protein JSV49_10425 [Thermoplasmata archaeon]